MLPIDSRTELTARQRFVFAGYLAILMALIFLLSCSACGARQTTDNAPTKSDPAVGLLELPGGGTCTGWKVGDDMVATAGHCCKTSEEELEDSEDDGTGAYSMKGTHAVPGAELNVLVDDDIHDICILKGLMKGAPIELAAWDPAIGDRVWTAGYPHGKFAISDGFWGGRDDDNWGMASQFVYYGASGSPLMNNAGQAVGIVVMLLRGTDNFALMATLEHMRGALTLAKLRM